MPVEDQKKVEKHLSALHKRFGGEWIAVSGFGAITDIELISPGKHNFKPNFGYVVKRFINKNTGEMKIFPASLFVDNPNEI